METRYGIVGDNEQFVTVDAARDLPDGAVEVTEAEFVEQFDAAQVAALIVE